MKPANPGRRRPKAPAVPSPRRATLRTHPFDDLLAADPELARARREHARQTPKKRRAAAEWAYDCGMADHLFSTMLRRVGGREDPDAGYESGVMALAIDPLFAPALLTVGSLEYQCQRPETAMRLFLTLTTLPPDEPDLAMIIDKAGSFLLDQKDMGNAIRLYRAATEAYPNLREHWSNLSYCLGKSGEMEEAIATARKAVSLDESNPRSLNDLGWTLVLAGRYEEARAVLERAVASAPPDYDLPRANLRELDEREQAARRRGRKPS